MVSTTTYLTDVTHNLVAKQAFGYDSYNNRQDVWEYDNLIDTRTVDTHMRRLREKLGRAARYLDTVRGVGYRFVEN